MTMIFLLRTFFRVSPVVGETQQTTSIMPDNRQTKLSVMKLMGAIVGPVGAEYVSKSRIWPRNIESNYSERYGRRKTYGEGYFLVDLMTYCFSFAKKWRKYF